MNFMAVLLSQFCTAISTVSCKRVYVIKPVTVWAYALAFITQNTMRTIVKILLPLLCSRICIIDVDIVIPVYMSTNFFVGKVCNTTGGNTIKSIIFNNPLDLVQGKVFFQIAYIQCHFIKLSHLS